MQYDVIKTSIAENLGLPKDAVLDLPLVSITGSREITIDNFKNIKEFTDKKVIITAGKGLLLELCGHGLAITLLTKETIVIRGDIENVNFVK